MVFELDRPVCLKTVKSRYCTCRLREACRHTIMIQLRHEPFVETTMQAVIRNHYLRPWNNMKVIPCSWTTKTRILKSLSEQKMWVRHQIIHYCRKLHQSVLWRSLNVECIQRRRDVLRTVDCWVCEFVHYRYCIGVGCEPKLQTSSLNANSLLRFRQIGVHQKILAYKTLIRPILEYAKIIWDPYTVTNKSKLDKIQRLALRFFL